MINCANCGTPNAAGHRFCSGCGDPLATLCPNCETANEPTNKFCFNCGAGLEESSSDPVDGSQPPKAVADPGERRLVSVLFADLVGFTTFSEGKDPEDVRNMLTHFYEKCREIIARYGGVTDKFIGDAVMGVWGAKGAHEDDAERATRAGLELVDMVFGLGGELGIDDLAARAGVLSGEASVGSGGNEQGLVVGDLVNTASRLQSIAEPGSVYVGAATRDMIGTTIEFRDVGDQTVKGKDQPVRVFEALRVLALSTAKTGGDLLEGPFVGRSDELRLLKDQLHATGRENRARMVSVIGEGGIGKSRLAQELIRYIDGIAEVVYYHRGRSPSYGDGVSFWALGEMIKQRAGISETEDQAKGRLKLRTMVADFAPAEEDQRWIEPRLASVVGLAESPAGDRAEHFAALRGFFQAIANRGTVLMVFEDLHWADDGLLDFIEELVERTTSNPILVVCLARPELLEKRPEWAASHKRTLTMHLGRLDEAAMTDLVTGLAPGLPEPIVERIAGRTAGVPLHAVEFVRMLLNTGQLVRTGDGFEFTGSDDDMPVPDSVSAIIGARLDRLDPETQSVLRDASVLGLTFTLSALATLRGEDTDEISAVLRDLTRREILEFDENPRSPERGQYRFLQGLIREVAYGRLTRQERVARHLSVAEMFESLDDPQLAGVVASHYAYAVESDPDDRDLLTRACRAVVEAAERASSLKSDTQAATLYERAAEMTDDIDDRNRLQLKAAECLARTGREDKGAELARRVLQWAQENQETAVEIRAVNALAHIMSGNFEAAEAAGMVFEVYQRVPRSSDPEWIGLARETSRALMLADRSEEAIVVADEVLPEMERSELIGDLLNTLINKGTAMFREGRLVEGAALLNGVASMAADRDLHFLRLRALNNLAAAARYDKTFDLAWIEELDLLSQRVGEEAWLVRNYFFSAVSMIDFGLWDDALARVEAGEALDLSEFWADNFEVARLMVELTRYGTDDAKLARFLEVQDKYLETDDPQLRTSIVSSKGEMLLATGDLEGALEATRAIEDLRSNFPEIAEVAVFASAQLKDEETLRDLTRRLQEQHPHGRASRGLGSVAESYLHGLQGDVAAAEKAFEDAENLWAKTITPRVLAYARAVYALVVGLDSEAAAARSRQARQFFEEACYRLYLDGIMAQLPDADVASELAG